MAKEKSDVLEAPKEAVIEPPKRMSVLPKQVSRVFKLIDPVRQGKVNIDGTEDVIDPETGQVRRARLLRGAQSIWMDKQAMFTVDYVRKNKLSLQFIGGNCVIPHYNKLHIEFATLSNRNMDNPHRFGTKDIYFKEWNPVKQSQESFANKSLMFEAIGIARSQPLEKMMIHAKYLNIDFIDQVGLDNTEEAIRVLYMDYAQNNPKQFMASVDSPVVVMNSLVRRALEEGKIDLGQMPGQVYWVNGGHISPLPQGRDAIEFLTEFAMLDKPENVQFATLLKQLIR